MAFDTLVIAAGAWSTKMTAQLGEPFPLQSQRGYNATLPVPGVALRSFVTFAEDHFVATPMFQGRLRIGGAVEFGGLSAAPNFARSRALLTLAGRYLPGLNTQGGVPGEGLRPATPDNLPVIGRSKNHDNVLYAFGHGHLGLSLAPTTGRLLAELMGGGASLDPYRLDVRTPGP